MERDDGRRVSRKRELKLVEDKFAREVTFSKRKDGLFRKASELSLLCGAEIAIIAYSPHATPFVFGAPSPDAVLRRLAGEAAAPVGSGLASSSSCGGRIGAYSRQDKLAVSRLKEVKSLKLPAAAEGHRTWWEDPIEGMGAEELERFIERMDLLKVKVEGRVEEKGKAAASAATPAAAVFSAPVPAAGEVVGFAEEDITALWDSTTGPDKGEAALLGGGGGGGGTGSLESLGSLFNGQFGSPETLSSDHLTFDFDLWS